MILKPEYVDTYVSKDNIFCQMNVSKYFREGKVLISIIVTICELDTV